MTPAPIYTPENLNEPAYHLRYTWTGWPSSVPVSATLSDSAWQDLEAAWESEGIRKLTGRWLPDKIQMTFSVKPQVSPVLFASRVKGRLQYALRRQNTPVKFSRKLAVRAIGHNHTKDIEAYLSRQVDKCDLVDSKFKEFLQTLRIADEQVDLSAPTETNSGRYWYNLHLVLVVGGRFHFAEENRLTTLRDWCVKIAGKKEHQLAYLSVMPDHLHVALRGNLDHTPEDVALAFLNNLAYAMGQQAIWEFGYYVGTFSEYDMNAVRNRDEQV